MTIKRRHLLTGTLLGLGAVASYKYRWFSDPKQVVAPLPPVVAVPPPETAVAVVTPPPVLRPMVQFDNEAPVMIEEIHGSHAAADQPQIQAMTPEDRVRFFERNFVDDVYLPESEHALLEAVLARLNRSQHIIGHGNFNAVGFDDLLAYAKRYPDVGGFTREELAFIEKIFFTDASVYGFLGKKVTHELTQPIKRGDIVKIPHSGHYLFRGDSEAYYHKLIHDIGVNVILTSGIRSNVKQLYLFLAKASVSDYNLSKASRSLAPPGYSYHGIGDFDVGKTDWGEQNFTDNFALTDEYKRMLDLGYVQIRYTEDNRFGVRFEPWHIKVV